MEGDNTDEDAGIQMGWGVSPCLQALLWTSCRAPRNSMGGTQGFNCRQRILGLQSEQEFSHVQTPPEPLGGVCSHASSLPFLKGSSHGNDVLC